MKCIYKRSIFRSYYISWYIFYIIYIYIFPVSDVFEWELDSYIHIIYQYIYIITIAYIEYARFQPYGFGQEKINLEYLG